VTEAEFDRPTRCAPWTARALLAHVAVGAGRVITMLTELAPSAADTDAARYYRPDQRFSSATNRERVDSAVEAAVQAGSGAALAAHFARTWRAAYASAVAQPAGRVVRTRHGDAMLLTDFMVTRVVELALHGLDLADAFDRPQWTDDNAVDVVTRLLVSEAARPRLDALGWDRMTLLRVATGRAGGEDRAEAERLRTAGITWLALG
jgi:Mycothiol maleylpyruvate isomerase N-terminal domain